MISNAAIEKLVIFGINLTKNYQNRTLALVLTDLQKKKSISIRLYLLTDFKKEELLNSLCIFFKCMYTDYAEIYDPIYVILRLREYFKNSNNLNTQ